MIILNYVYVIVKVFKVGAIDQIRLLVFEPLLYNFLPVLAVPAILLYVHYFHMSLLNLINKVNWDAWPNLPWLLTQFKRTYFVFVDALCVLMQWNHFSVLPSRKTSCYIRNFIFKLIVAHIAIYEAQPKLLIYRDIVNFKSNGFSIFVSEDRIYPNCFASAPKNQTKNMPITDPTAVLVVFCCCYVIIWRLIPLSTSRHWVFETQKSLEDNFICHHALWLKV